MDLSDDTIVAVSTAPGRGGIGIVRLSGKEAVGIAGVLCRTRRALVAGRTRFGAVLDEGGVAMDEAVVTLHAAPHSYTGEDVVEIACHGAPVLLEELVRRAIAAGARLAEPGEFTRRAWFSGRLDLTQAEAVNDLIAAQTLQQARVAAAQLGGALSRALAPVKQRLLELIAALEAGVDFAEDDLDLLPDAAIAEQMAAVMGPLERLADSYRYGRTVREGFTLAIVGRPNAGKSSLFNRLLRRDRAIVTAQAGTTRDSVAEMFELGGIPVRLVDTAGLREIPVDEAEMLGIARTRMAMAEAEVVLLVVDATAMLHGDDLEVLELLVGRPHLVVLNKWDLVDAHRSGDEAAAKMGHGVPVRAAVRVSALTGDGVAELERAIVAALGVAPGSSDSAMVTNLRQHGAVEEAVGAMARARNALGSGLPHEMLLLDLHAGLEALDMLTGATSTEDLLGMIFSRFCIGK